MNDRFQIEKRRFEQGVDYNEVEVARLLDFLARVFNDGDRFGAAENEISSSSVRLPSIVALTRSTRRPPVVPCGSVRRVSAPAVKTMSVLPMVTTSPSRKTAPLTR